MAKIKIKKQKNCFRTKEKRTLWKGKTKRKYTPRWQVQTVLSVHAVVYSPLPTPASLSPSHLLPPLVSGGTCKPHTPLLEWYNNGLTLHLHIHPLSIPIELQIISILSQAPTFPPDYVMQTCHPPGFSCNGSTFVCQVDSIHSDSLHAVLACSGLAVQIHI